MVMWIKGTKPSTESQKRTMSAFAAKYATDTAASGEKLTDYNRQVLMMLDWFQTEMEKQRKAGMESEVELTIKDVTQTIVVFEGLLTLKNIPEVRRKVLRATEKPIGAK